MKPVIFLLVTKITSLAGATLNTVGFLAFFFWESLEPYRWKMIGGGILLIVVSELIGHFFIKKMIKDAESLEGDEDSEEFEY